MRIASIELSAWRNYSQQRLDMATSPTLLVGENGQGKTNFVEAIVYAALGRSHRTWSDATLVRQGADHAIVRMKAVHGSRTLDVDMNFDGHSSTMFSQKPGMVRRTINPNLIEL